MKLTNTEILAFSVKVATWHPLIGHVAADKSKQRVYGFNHQELLDKEKSKLNFKTLVLGLSLPGQVNVAWAYKDTGSAPMKNKYFDIVVLGAFSGSDYTKENLQCERSEEVLDHLLTWLYEKTNDPSGCDWPLLEMIDTDNIQCRRVQDIGIAELSGAVMRIPVRDYVSYNPSTNPFEAMTP